MFLAAVVIGLLYFVAVIVAQLLGNQRQKRIANRCLREILTTFGTSPVA